MSFPQHLISLKIASYTNFIHFKQYMKNIIDQSAVLRTMYFMFILHLSIALEVAKHFGVLAVPSVIGLRFLQWCIVEGYRFRHFFANCTSIWK